MTTYYGRVRHFFGMVNLRNNFITDTQLRDAQALLAAHSATRKPAAGSSASGTLATDEENAALWNAKRVVAAIVHPDTGERVPAAFRMCAFMPVNLPITAGMLLSGPGAAQLAWQVVNQSYNAGFNYFNRNASVPTNMTTALASYAIATSTAVGAAYGLGRVVARLQRGLPGGGGPGAPPPSLSFRLLSRGLPWFAVASAGAANALAMRYSEGITGVTVYDAPPDAGGVAVGTSVTAGRTGLAQIALTRVVLPMPILLVPPFILDAARASRRLGPAMASSLPVRLAVELSVVAVFLQCALPFAVALFPQVGALPAASLEPQFHGRRDAAGRVIETYYYNKGL